MIYHGNCRTCDAPFTWDSVNRGRKRKYCSAKCNSRIDKRGSPGRGDPFVECSTPDCGRSPVYLKSGLCHACTGALRRNGTLQRLKVRGRRHTSERGYISVLDPSHPLAKLKGGRVLEHRKVLYDAIGEGPHPCYWCARVLDWPALVVDHLNENKADNRRTNLVPSCNDCNRARGAMLPFIARLTDEAMQTFITAALAFRTTEAAATIASKPRIGLSGWASRTDKTRTVTKRAS